MEPRPAAYERLLAALQERVLASESLASEWHQRAAEDPWGADDEHGARRFREWFLLEHAPAALGAPPAAVWAPEDVEDGSAWQGLLEARFGVFRLEEDGGDTLRDLWSGRTLRLDEPMPGATAGTLVLGRLAPAGEDRHLLLPSALLLHAPEVAEALTADLARLRAREGRARLSAAELERLLARVLPAPPTPSPDDALAGLADLLGTAPGWDPDRIQEIAAREGWNAVLDRLAFETDVDLDRARQWIAELRQVADSTAATETPAAGAPTATREDDRLDPGQRDRALRAFDAEAEERSVQERLARLERALELTHDDPPEPAVTPPEDAAAVGPEDLPGMPFWIASYAWECSQEGDAPDPERLEVLGHFAEFLRQSHERPRDPAEIVPADLYGYLLQSPTPAELAHRRRQAGDFFRWLAAEQQAPIADALDALDGALGPVLEAAVATNAHLASAGRGRRHTATLLGVDPPEARLGEDRVPVEALPDEAARHARPGDRLLGERDAEGRLVLGAWLPATLLP